MANALFVCLHNVGRSRLARCSSSAPRTGATTPGRREPLPATASTPGRGGDERAGDRPQRSTAKLLSTEDAEWADVVVTMGCGDKCPYVPDVR
jgi:arsenate reductase